jgi:hypothetical protein
MLSPNRSWLAALLLVSIAAAYRSPGDFQLLHSPGRENRQKKPATPDSTTKKNGSPTVVSGENDLAADLLSERHTPAPSELARRTSLGAFRIGLGKNSTQDRMFAASITDPAKIGLTVALVPKDAVTEQLSQTGEHQDHGR